MQSNPGPERGGRAPLEIELVPADRNSSWLLRLDGQDQSHVDLDDPTRLAFDYVRRIGDVLDLHQPGAPLRAVHIGGAAMTLPRYLATVRPGSTQIVLEPAEEVTALVRERLPLPRGARIKVRPVDGRTGLAALREGGADVMVIDAFAGGRVPADLVSAEAITLAGRALTADGLLMFNLADRAPFAWSRRVIAGLRTLPGELMLSAEPATLKARRGGNLLAVYGPAGVPLPGLRKRASSSAAPYRVFDPAGISDSFGGAQPFTDASAEPSPAP